MGFLFNILEFPLKTHIIEFPLKTHIFEFLKLEGTYNVYLKNNFLIFKLLNWYRTFGIHYIFLNAAIYSVHTEFRFDGK